MNEIRHIFFDAGNVLLRFDQQRAFRQLAKLCHKTPDQIAEFYVGQNLHLDYESGKISSTELIERFIRFAARELDHSALKMAAADMFSSVAGMDSIVQALKSRGYELAIVSNTCEIHWEFIERNFAIVNLFPVKILSFEIGVMKPEAGFYQRALLQTGAKPEQTLFIDDLAVNIAGAKKAGFQTHLFKDAELLASFLQQKGLSI